MSIPKKEHSNDSEVSNAYKDAYSSSHVIQAIKTSSWFTPNLIVDIHEHEPDPQKEGLGPFNDDSLNIFFSQKLKLDNEKNGSYIGARNYLHQRMITNMGHPMSLDQIPFGHHEEIIKLAKEWQLKDNHEVVREMIGLLDNIIQSIIVPVDIRRPALKVLLPWGTEQIKQDTLLWAQLGKIGVQEWAKRK